MNISLKTMSYDMVATSELQPFSSELALVDKFEDFIGDFLCSSIHIEREFECGFGIADAVIFKYRQNSYAKDLAKLDANWAYTLKALPYRKNFTIADVSKLSGSSLQCSKKAVANFLDSGFCIKKDKDIYIKNSQPRKICSSIVGIEAKLKDWKKALWQASRYKTFATEAWVMLDRKHATSAIKNIDKFENFNIGLATFSSEGHYFEHFSPKKEVPQSEIASWKANTILAQKIIT
ncbi:hypothetical protein [Enterovibrio baiacu]|uniref:hypothetical protein n=1 Tax=Enterovibrio baiacu TaxID=2491023 RepID=UPI003D118E64